MIDEKVDERPAILTLENVRKDLGASKETMRAIIPGITLRITKGEFVAITGPSGSGKSTLLYLMGALDKPTSGSIRFDGDEISAMPEEKLVKIRNVKIGFIYQFHFLLPEFTALENVTMPMLVAGRARKEARERGESLLERVGLKEKIDRRPSQLSGGEQQRVAVARALVNRPLLLLCDEPTGSLDSKSSMQVFDLITELNAEGQTVVYVTHDTALASRANRRIHIVDGRIEREERGENSKF